MSESEEFLAKLGTWDEDGMTFKFFNEQEVNGFKVRSIVLHPQALAELPPELTREDVLVMMLDPDLESEEIPDSGGLREATVFGPSRREAEHGDAPGADA